MEPIHIQPLADEELRPQLEARASIVFDGQAIRFHEIERQVERLGFGDSYIVSSAQGPLSNNSKISLKPSLLGGSIARISDASARVVAIPVGRAA